MEKIIKIPIISIENSGRGSVERESFITTDSFRTVSMYNHRFYDDQNSSEITKIQMYNGNSFFCPFKPEDFMRLFNCAFIAINRTAYVPIKKITSMMSTGSRVYSMSMDSYGDSYTINGTTDLAVFDGKNILQLTFEQVLSIWERELTNRPIIKNLKIASGGNIV